jgi:carboxyl-terminal processing protease
MQKLYSRFTWDNGGGYLEKAVEIADEFCQNLTLIVLLKTERTISIKRLQLQRIDFKKRQSGHLVDENSASTSGNLAER